MIPADLATVLAIFGVALIAITFHEAAHAYVAWACGDDTAKRMGRASFNPIRHIDLFGTILLPALLYALHSPFLFGWAKPVPVNWSRLKHFRRGMMLVAAAGPVANFVLATISGAIILGIARLGVVLPVWLTTALQASVVLNLLLGAFNLIPIPPLDGSKVLAGILPEKSGASHFGPQASVKGRARSGVCHSRRRMVWSVLRSGNQKRLKAADMVRHAVRRGAPMRFSALAMLAMMVISSAIAAEPPSLSQQQGWQPAAGFSQIPLWPEGLAIAKPEARGTESVRFGGGMVAGRHWTAVENVSRPTMTIYPAKARNSGAAILVFPGGGYGVLAIDLEGTEVCDWATSIGITCAVLKYRVPQNWWPKECGCQREPQPFLPLQDAQRAMGLLRQQAKSLGIDPHKIGVIGFSAGGHLVTAISNAAGRSYAPVDAADRESARPDFAIALYPGHLWGGDKHLPFDKGDLKLMAFDHVGKDAPPTFIAQAEDDPMDDVRNAITYFLALKQAAVPVEIHLFAHGGHAFGLRPTAMPITHWPLLAEQWLHTIGILSGDGRN